MGKAFEALSRDHDRAGFDCGVTELNAFLRQHARRQQEHGISRSVVLVDDGVTPPKPILGFFTLVAARLDSSEIAPRQAKRLPHRVPCVLLARLAVSSAHQGQGIGKLLLVEAATRVARIASELGVAGLFVEAKDDTAAQFYQHFGFVPFPDNQLKLFQPLSGLGVKG